MKKQQADYCKVNYEQAKQRGDNNADLAEGPLGPVPRFRAVSRQEVEQRRRGTRSKRCRRPSTRALHDQRLLIRLTY